MMDEKLYEIIKETSTGSDAIFNCYINLINLLSGPLFIDEKRIESSFDIESVIDNGGLSTNAFDFDKLYSLTIKKNIISSHSEGEEILPFLNEQRKGIINYYSNYLSIIRKILVSLEKMIPAELDEEGNVIASKVREYSMLMSKKVAEIDNRIQYLLNEATTSNIINAETIVAANQVSNYMILHGVIALSLCSFKFINFHQLTYEYFYGSNDKRNDIMKQIKDEFLRMKNEMQEELSSKVNYIDEKMDKMNKSNEQNFDNLDKRIDQLNQVVEKKDRVEKTRPLKLTTCLDAIEEVYDDPKYNYTQQFKLHPYAIRKLLSDWNQYLITGGKKGKPPLPKFDFYRHTDKQTFKKWVIYEFFLDYENRAHKDALDNASRLDTENTPGSDGQEIIDAVEESLANDSNNNARKDPNNNTKDEQSEPPSNEHK